jgi:outer membrane receptor for ferrienterochelin and colicin
MIRGSGSPSVRVDGQRVSSEDAVAVNAEFSAAEPDFAPERGIFEKFK